MGRRARAQVLGMSDKGPWGGGGDSGNGSGGGGGGDDGPRNPWSMPPSGKRGRIGGSTSLDDFLKRARSGGPGGGPSMPANAGRLWLAAVAALILVWIAFTSFHSIGPTKMSYKDQRDLDLLPGRIEELEAAIERDEALLADPALYTKDPKRFAALTAQIDKARAEKDAAEERWLALAEMAEA